MSLNGRALFAVLILLCLLTRQSKKICHLLNHNYPILISTIDVLKVCLVDFILWSIRPYSIFHKPIPYKKSIVKTNSVSTTNNYETKKHYKIFYFAGYIDVGMSHIFRARRY